MKTTVLRLQEPESYPEFLEYRPAIYRIPTLPAYAVEFAELWAPSDADGAARTHFLMGDGFYLYQNTLEWREYRSGLFGHPVIDLVIHYHGIRDYEGLFPSVDDSERRSALASYYRESEVALDGGAWLSFCLMCGSIFEGMLGEALGVRRRTFGHLIYQARRKRIISASDARVMNRVRNLRNQTHLDRAGEDQVTRADALDARKVLDHAIRRLSEY